MCIRDSTISVPFCKVLFCQNPHKNNVKTGISLNGKKSGSLLNNVKYWYLRRHYSSKNNKISEKVTVSPLKLYNLLCEILVKITKFTWKSKKIRFFVDDYRNLVYNNHSYKIIHELFYNYGYYTLNCDNRQQKIGFFLIFKWIL